MANRYYYVSQSGACHARLSPFSILYGRQQDSLNIPSTKGTLKEVLCSKSCNRELTEPAEKSAGQKILLVEKDGEEVYWIVCGD